ncbi:response regulator transcription factor [Serratia ureilytica]|uniref:response regulator transcription factor n=1 Tax=Serratia ureilytica TaxID=300181 RepID=UPI001D18743E|nr:helix-turn-helix transcriptional regulator [Serratia ureilytica]MCC4104765.1 helix-turn-helix transcriptional regulator [Serratia ureilytica]
MTWQIWLLQLLSCQLRNFVGDLPLAASYRPLFVLAKSTALIAAMLGLSERTVENHLRRIRRRLGAATTAQAISVAIRLGEIAPESR